MQESVTRHMPLACVSFDASVSFEFISVTDACTHIQNMCCDTSPFACTKRGNANSVSLMATHDQQQNLANADQKYCTFTLKSLTLPIAVHGQFCKPYSIAHVKHGWTVAHCNKSPYSFNTRFFFSRDACVFAMSSHLIVVVTTD